ncbi:hypothetical protein COU74_00510 [Candidatus Peregrinibacteria bacterium CG10_big_fil_rev_8_21_14_0_10_36_19]|nr:MAG: hypothetical protein COU74_00510 [Candidatus Peregrinibacteria bacterium CG10_big_fil_rev_8_21_14_0_10_36_19]
MDFGDFFRGEMWAKLNFLSFVMEVGGGARQRAFVAFQGQFISVKNCWFLAFCCGFWLDFSGEFC